MDRPARYVPVMRTQRPCNSLSTVTRENAMSKIRLNAPNKSNKPGPSHRQEDEPVHEDLLLELECPICANYMFPPILLCRTGHNICTTCRQKLPHCAICKANFTETRNFSLEKLSQQLCYPCTNRQYGCQQVFPFKEKSQHVNQCPYKGFKCHMPNCSWFGSFKDLLYHGESYHGEDVMVYNAEDTWSVCVTDKECYISMIQAYDQVFWFKCKVVTKNVYWACQCVGDAETAERFEYDIEIFKEGCKKKILLSNRCHDVNLGNSQLFNNETCISIHLSSLRCFWTDNALFSYRFRLKPVAS